MDLVDFFPLGSQSCDVRKRYGDMERDGLWDGFWARILFFFCIENGN